MVGPEALEAIETLILEFPWYNYGLDAVSDAADDPDPSCRAWARDLAAKIAGEVNSRHGVELPR